MNLAPYIDHTLLRATATQTDIIKLCDEARRYGFASVCVNPCWCDLIVEQLQRSEVWTCCVVGFPLGATYDKLGEATTLVKRGVREIDFVMNLGDFKGGDSLWSDEFVALRACLPTTVLKVILETGELTDAEIVTACRAAANAGLDFVKTSTGFGKGGATVEHVRLMKAAVGDSCDVKASGGIRDYDTAMAMIDAGATRLGTSNGIAIMNGAPR